MEHRWSVRKPIAGHANLTLPAGIKLQTDVVDLSLGGVGLTAPAQVLPVNSILTLAIILDSDGRVNRYRLAAQVAHSNPRRLGLLFLDPDYETVHGLRVLLTMRNDRSPADTGPLLPSTP